MTGRPGSIDDPVIIQDSHRRHTLVGRQGLLLLTSERGSDRIAKVSPLIHPPRDGALAVDSGRSGGRPGPLVLLGGVLSDKGMRLLSTDYSRLMAKTRFHLWLTEACITDGPIRGPRRNRVLYL